ncbi:MAG: hypothetical protein GF401_06365 [Chitinivibrionales bacterium]|nr:hypothetical protein [Chitinivibrionales bacterium]
MKRIPVKNRLSKFVFSFTAALTLSLVVVCTEDSEDPKPCPTCPGVSEDAISVTKPDSSTVWQHWNFNNMVEWEGAYGDSVQIKLYQNGILVDVYPHWVPNAGTYTSNLILDSAWGEGENFKIQVIDKKGNEGWSDPFVIAKDPLATVLVLYPDTATLWYHGSLETDDTLRWSVGAAEGDTVDILLYHKTGFVDTIAGKIPNTGQYILRNYIKYSWGSGSGFQVKIVDNLGYFGWSKGFEIKAEECENITVTYPDSSVSWYSGDHIDFTARWDMCCGDSVVFLLYANQFFIDTIQSWVDTADEFTTEQIVHKWWGEGDGFHIKIVDNNNNFGYSPTFSIVYDSAQSIYVEMPDNQTEWHRGQMRTIVKWSMDTSIDTSADAYTVKADVYYKNERVTELFSWVTAESMYIHTDSIPVDWDTGDGYQLRLENKLGDFGWSGSFKVDSGGTIEVEFPEDSSIWLHGETGMLIEWEATGEDSVRGDLYRNGSLVNELFPWIYGNEYFLVTIPIPAQWGEGDTYRVRVEALSGDYGWSEPFTLESDTAATITITHPDSMTIWYSGQESTYVQFGGYEGDSARFELFKDGQYYDEFAGWQVLDSGETVFVLSSAIPTFWPADNRYKIRMIDNNRNHGWSPGYFEIKEDSLDRIVVMSPDTETVMYHGQDSLTVRWQDAPGDSVRLKLFKADSSLVAVIGDWMPDTGVYIDTNDIPSLWGTGDGFYIKVVDNSSSLHYYGTSGRFSIEEDSTRQIVVHYPDSMSVWAHEDTLRKVEWDYLDTTLAGDSVLIEVYKGNTFIDTVIEWSPYDSTQTLSRQAAIPVSWGTGNDFRLKIYDNNGLYGWSEYFVIRKD